MLSKQKVKFVRSELQVSQPGLKRLPRVLKKKLKKESPAGSPSSSDSSQPVTNVKPTPKPKPIASTSKPAQKAPTEKVLASIVRQFLQYFRLDAQACEQLKDPKIDPKVFAAKIVSGPFMSVLGKYRGYNYQRLMELATEYARAEHPEVEQPKQEEPKEKKPKRLTEAQKWQSAQTPRVQPVVNMVPRHPRKRKAKAALDRKKCDDPFIVLSAFDAFLESDEQLKAEFCQLSLVDAERFVRSDSRIVKFAEELKPQLASPTWVYKYLDAASAKLIPEYRDKQLAKEQEARERAEKRRAELAADMRKLEQKRLRKEQLNEPFEYTRVGGETRVYSRAS